MRCARPNLTLHGRGPGIARGCNVPGGLQDKSPESAPLANPCSNIAHQDPIEVLEGGYGHNNPNDWKCVSKCFCHLRCAWHALLLHPLWSKYNLDQFCAFRHCIWTTESRKMYVVKKSIPGGVRNTCQQKYLFSISVVCREGRKAQLKLWRGLFLNKH